MTYICYSCNTILLTTSMPYNVTYNMTRQITNVSSAVNLSFCSSQANSSLFYDYDKTSYVESVLS